MDHLLLGVDGLGKAAQKHRRSGDVLASPSELWDITTTVCCAERAGAGGDWLYRLCRNSSSCSYVRARASARGFGGV